MQSDEFILKTIIKNRNCRLTECHLCPIRNYSPYNVCTISGDELVLLAKKEMERLNSTTNVIIFNSNTNVKIDLIEQKVTDTNNKDTTRKWVLVKIEGNSDNELFRILVKIQQHFDITRGVTVATKNQQAVLNKMEGLKTKHNILIELRANNLLKDNGHEYGSRWLCDTGNQKKEDRIIELVEKLIRSVNENDFILNFNLLL